jgi:hypothetical protein
MVGVPKYHSSGISRLKIMLSEIDLTIWHRPIDKRVITFMNLGNIIAVDLPPGRTLTHRCG